MMHSDASRTNTHLFVRPYSGSLPLRGEGQLLAVKQRRVVGREVGIFKQLAAGETLSAYLVIVLGWNLRSELARWRRLKRV